MSAELFSEVEMRFAKLAAAGAVIRDAGCGMRDSGAIREAGCGVREGKKKEGGKAEGWTPFLCAGCRGKVLDGGVTCFRCWGRVPEGLRDRWLRARDAREDEAAVRAVCGFFGIRKVEWVRCRKQYPAALWPESTVAELLAQSPYNKADARGAGRRWECQGCGRMDVSDDESICGACFAGLPEGLRRAWSGAEWAEEGPAWEAVVAWLEGVARGAKGDGESAGAAKGETRLYGPVPCLNEGCGNGCSRREIFCARCWRGNEEGGRGKSEGGARGLTQILLWKILLLSHLMTISPRCLCAAWCAPPFGINGRFADGP